MRPTFMRTVGTAAVLALPTVAVASTAQTAVAAAPGGSQSNNQLYAKLQQMATAAATDSDGSDTNFSARRAEFLIWDQAAKLRAFVQAEQAEAQAEQRAQQAAFYAGVQRQIAQRPHYALPDSGVLTQGYGGPGGHPGIDLAGPYGSPILAAASGVVAFAGQQSGYGNFIEIQDADGTYTAYGHLSSIGVSTGEQVGAGQQIGEEGSTGESTGPHLHFEVRTGLNGPTEDPLAWLNARGITVTGQG